MTATFQIKQKGERQNEKARGRAQPPNGGQVGYAVGADALTKTNILLALPAAFRLSVAAGP